MKYVKLSVLLVLASLLLMGCAIINPPTVEEETGQIDPEVDYASGGTGFFVVLNGVGLQVNAIQVLPAEDREVPGYSYVVLNMGVSNESNLEVRPGTFRLVDDFANEYASWQTNVPFSDQLTPLPAAVARGDVANGSQAFLVPTSALQSSYRLRWESEAHTSIIDIFIERLQVEGQ